MTVFVLEGFSTDSRDRDDVRHREYTSSVKKAELFKRIPKIQFTDSGHGIVFDAREHRGPRRANRHMEYVAEHMDRLRQEDAAAKPKRATWKTRAEAAESQRDNLKAALVELVSELDAHWEPYHYERRMDKALSRARQLVEGERDA